MLLLLYIRRVSWDHLNNQILSRCRDPFPFHCIYNENETRGYFRSAIAIDTITVSIAPTQKRGRGRGRGPRKRTGVQTRFSFLVFSHRYKSTCGGRMERTQRTRSRGYRQTGRTRTKRGERMERPTVSRRIRGYRDYRTPETSKLPNEMDYPQRKRPSHLIPHPLNSQYH